MLVQAIKARRALDMHPLLREHLQGLGKQRVKDSTLVGRLRRLHKEGGIPSSLTSAKEARFNQVMNHRIRSNIVSHHNLVNPDRTLSIWQFMEEVLHFFSDHLLNKVEVVLKCQFEEKDRSTPTRSFRSR